MYQYITCNMKVFLMMEEQRPLCYVWWKGFQKKNKTTSKRFSGARGDHGIPISLLCQLNGEVREESALIRKIRYSANATGGVVPTQARAQLVGVTIDISKKGGRWIQNRDKGRSARSN